VLSALAGYVLGTIQIVLVDWVRNRMAHRRKLKLLRADLRNAATYDKKFNWRIAGQNDEVVPRAPEVSPAFFSTLAAVDFELTDEHQDDNTQQALLGITSGFDVLRLYLEKWQTLTDEMSHEVDAALREILRQRGISYMCEYDGRVDEVLFLIHDAIRDLDRRIKAASVGAQIRRIGKRLPPGTNPPPLGRADPRVRAFVDERECT